MLNEVTNDKIDNIDIFSLVLSSILFIISLCLTFYLFQFSFKEHTDSAFAIFTLILTVFDFFILCRDLGIILTKLKHQKENKEQSYEYLSNNDKKD